MEHFSEHIWADFVRGLNVQAKRQELDAHLASACPDCQAAFAVWTRVASLAANECDYVPPEGLVRLVKLQFATERAADKQDWTMARLAFDSATQPPPAGIRGGMARARQLLYEADGLTVDLRLEQKQQSSIFVASGQVLDRDSPLSWLGDAAIVLSTDKGETVTKTITNSYGEFQFEFEPHEQLRISVITPNRKTVRIALGNIE
jgi:hypothetical protein